MHQVHKQHQPSYQNRVSSPSVVLPCTQGQQSWEAAGILISLQRH
uniref:Uncharacterized protein n=1 Tax=Arundo donax TaxID=35708 RepID=A0A0A9E3U0_ARUDO